jgi:hypothetical protein
MHLSRCRKNISITTINNRKNNLEQSPAQAGFSHFTATLSVFWKFKSLDGDLKENPCPPKPHLIIQSSNSISAQMEKTEKVL